MFHCYRDDSGRCSWDYISDYIAENVSMTTIAVMLFITGMALWLIRNMKGTKGEREITIKDAFIVGLGQAVALTPGISRSGATIISAVAVGMKPETALRFPFMLYIPVSLGGVVLGLTDFLNEPNKSELAIPYVATFIATLLMTYFAMKWFIGIMKNGKLDYFTYYCSLRGFTSNFLLRAEERAYSTYFEYALSF